MKRLHMKGGYGMSGMAPFTAGGEDEGGAEGGRRRRRRTRRSRKFFGMY